MRYESPVTSEAAVALLAEESGVAQPLAGGTDLLVQMYSGSALPDLVVDLKRIPELCSIMPENNGFRIGGAVPSIRISEHPELRARWPGVVEAMALVGSTQIQGRATLAGNLCNASPAADSVPAMMAASAKVRILGPEGARECPVEAVVTAPGQTSLVQGEIVESIYLPPLSPYTGSAYLRFIPRTEMDIAVVGVAVHLEMDAEGVCQAAKVALGAVAPMPILAPAAALIGTKVDATALGQLAEACKAVCKPIDDKRGTVDFRVHVAGVLARRAAETALMRARMRARRQG